MGVEEAGNRRLIIPVSSERVGFGRFHGSHEKNPIAAKNDDIDLKGVGYQHVVLLTALAVKSDRTALARARISLNDVVNSQPLFRRKAGQFDLPINDNAELSPDHLSPCLALNSSIDSPSPAR